MATKLFVDTNVLLRYILGDHEAMFVKAKQLLEGAGEGVFVVTGEVVAEVVYGLRQAGYDRLAIAQALLSLLDMPMFELENKSAITAAISTFAGQGLDYVDCYLLERAARRGCGLATLDKKLHNAWAARA